MTTTDAIFYTREYLDRVHRLITSERCDPMSVLVPPAMFDALGLDPTALNYAEVGPELFVRLERGVSYEFKVMIDSWRMFNQFVTEVGKKRPHDIATGGIAVNWDVIAATRGAA